MARQPRTLAGRVAAVTGAARGIGRATAEALVHAGMRVAIGDLDAALAERTAREIRAVAFALDVTDRGSFDRFVARVEERLGPIDVLVNNAGIMPVGRIIDEPDAVTHRILDINVFGVILGSKLAVQRMVPRGRGHVVNVASLAGEIYAAGLATYCASKHAVVAFTDSARLEYRKAGVKFSMVSPSFVNTELISGTHGARGFKNAEPGDIADAIIGLIARPKPRVRVTRAAGAMVASQYFMPRLFREGLNRILGGEHVFTDDVDVEKRKAYEARARGAE
jgi:NAD(P)-dependent dehydrogenase (short-subunit alcohol dehydrogenase family)